MRDEDVSPHACIYSRAQVIQQIRLFLCMFIFTALYFSDCRSFLYTPVNTSCLAQRCHVLGGFGLVNGYQWENLRNAAIMIHDDY